MPIEHLLSGPEACCCHGWRPAAVTAGCVRVLMPAQTPSSSKNAGPSLRACNTLRMLRSLSRTSNVFLTKMDALLPATQLNYSLPDLHRLPVRAQTPSSPKNGGPSLRACNTLRMLRSLSRTSNVFLTKMDALLPATQLNYSLPDLHRLPVRAQTPSSPKNGGPSLRAGNAARHSPPDLITRRSSSPPG